MDTHPFINHDVARLRTEERLSRSLAAIDALRSPEEQTAARRALTSARAQQLLDRLVRRDASAKRSARPAT